ncbi:NAD(P)/FAD-dependent oxidoreductase [Dietzia timorensis]|uniref:NADH:ubiquinone reductase (non-electrogenic) n=1 Tax=Dietzia timorensis TaxID=499555 RepID=A0A173LNR9_9ACTN|nr:NAD(P)/FAD-dependent oxidoreductase [Dietzia timorensis]ANI92352.1 putative NADH dehydrogenase [Dietzia timorensis]
MSTPATRDLSAGETSSTSRHHVVIIGSGFGGLFAAREFKGKNVDVTLIAKTGHHLFQPLLYQVATGILSVGEIAPPTRFILRDLKNVKIVLGDVSDIDVTAKKVKYVSGRLDIETSFDSLILAAGANQSYFGNDHFEQYAPGMKTVDDALELRGRILGAFEQAELTTDEVERRRLLTFVIVGAGPTGVEMAGQVAELARNTFKDLYRSIDPSSARVILLDAAPAVLPPFGPKLGDEARRALEKLGVEVQLGAMVSGVDGRGITVKDEAGKERRIESACKIWSAGVSASPLGAIVARQTGAEVDRSGRVRVEKDLSLPGESNIFIVGDMMALDDLPGVAQVAIQGGRYAARQIIAEVEGSSDPTRRKPFRYFDKGSMATVSRFNAVVKIGRIEIDGFLAWIMWLVVHLAYLVGFKSRFTALVSWGMHVMGNQRSQLTSTSQQVYARSALEHIEEAAATVTTFTPPEHVEDDSK